MLKLTLALKTGKLVNAFFTGKQQMIYKRLIIFLCKIKLYLFRIVNMIQKNLKTKKFNKFEKETLLQQIKYHYDSVNGLTGCNIMNWRFLTFNVNQTVTAIKVQRNEYVFLEQINM